MAWVTAQATTASYHQIREQREEEVKKLISTHNVHAG